LGIHLLWCPCKSEHIVSHNILQNKIATIVLESETHVQTKCSYLFRYRIQQWINILITRDNFWTLVNIVITNLTYPNIVQCLMSMTMHATIVAVQKKTWSYVDRASRDDFIPLGIETYGCLHFCFDSFFTFLCLGHYSPLWTILFSLVLMMLISYYQHVFIALQHV
jgi:hypothetical protein